MANHLLMNVYVINCKLKIDERNLNLKPFLSFKPLHPNINMHILYTFLSTFTKVLTRRISLTIESLVGDHFLYSPDLNV